MRFDVKFSKTDRSFQPEFDVTVADGGYDVGYAAGESTGYGKGYAVGETAGYAAGISEMESYNAGILKDCNTALLTCGVSPVERLEELSEQIKSIVEAFFMTVSVGGVKFYLDVSPSTPVKGIVVDENGRGTQYSGGQLPDNWNVKVMLNDSGVPVVILRDANVTEITGYPGRIGLPGNTVPVQVTLVGENTLTGSAPLSANGCDIVIGGTGSLRINGNDGLGCGKENITIKSGTVQVDVGYQATKVKTLVVEGGTLISKTVWWHPTNGKGIIAEQIVIKGGSVVAASPVGALSVAPDLSLYSGDYTAFGGQSSDVFENYNESKATSYGYFKIAPGNNAYMQG